MTVDIMNLKPGDAWPAHPDYEVQIAHLTPEQQQRVRDVFPTIWLQQSPLVEGAWVTTVPVLLMHVAALDSGSPDAAKELAKEKKRLAKEERRIVDAVFKVRFEQWRTDCKARNAAIAALDAEWHDAVAQSTAARKQWDEYVEAKREALRAARLWPVPEMPKRGT